MYSVNNWGLFSTRECSRIDNHNYNQSHILSMKKDMCTCMLFHPENLWPFILEYKQETHWLAFLCVHTCAARLVVISLFAILTHTLTDIHKFTTHRCTQSNIREANSRRYIFILIVPARAPFNYLPTPPTLTWVSLGALGHMFGFSNEERSLEDARAACEQQVGSHWFALMLIMIMTMSAISYCDCK